MSTKERRYDIDWLRVIAIGLLLIYHVAIGFQPWGMMIGFITSEESWASLWIPMAMLNIWRIPLLFFVSGMGVYFALQHRTWAQLIAERAKRILLPFVFGIFVVVPLSTFLWQKYNGLELSYAYFPGHLWFLGNIFAYVLLFSPAFYYLKRYHNGKLVHSIKSLFSTPLGLLVVLVIFTTEAMVIKPFPYELYAMTLHGFVLGLLAFFSGFCFMLAGDGFWKMLIKWGWLFVFVALSLYVVRITHFKINVPFYLLVIESDCWIFAVFAFAHRYLKHTGSTLTYLSKAAYPIYIVHMIWLMLGSMLIFPLGISVQFKFFLLLIFTFAGCFLSYEGIKRIPILRTMFGIG